MYCNKCGSENPQGAKFCRNCGHELKNSEKTVKATVIENDTGEEKTNQNYNTNFKENNESETDRNFDIPLYSDDDSDDSMKDCCCCLGVIFAIFAIILII